MSDAESTNLLSDVEYIDLSNTKSTNLVSNHEFTYVLGDTE